MQGNQLCLDLNNVVATGKNWSIPYVWGGVLKYISAPILAIITSFAYPTFYQEKRMDPTQIFAFAVAHIVMVMIAMGIIIPRSLDIFVPPEKKYLGKPMYAPQVVNLGVLTAEEAAQAAAGNRETEYEDVRYDGPKE